MRNARSTPRTARPRRLALVYRPPPRPPASGPAPAPQPSPIGRRYANESRERTAIGRRGPGGRQSPAQSRRHRAGVASPRRPPAAPRGPQPPPGPGPCPPALSSAPGDRAGKERGPRETGRFTSPPGPPLPCGRVTHRAPPTAIHPGLSREKPVCPTACGLPGGLKQGQKIKSASASFTLPVSFRGVNSPLLTKSLSL